MAQAGALGIDVEYHRPRDYHALAAHAFGPAEHAEVAADGADAFYRIWTLREAIAKATGEGLALAANGRDLLRRDPRVPGYCTDHAGKRWHLASVRIAPDVSLAVAHEVPREHRWSLVWSDLGRSASLQRDGNAEADLAIAHPR